MTEAEIQQILRDRAVRLARTEAAEHEAKTRIIIFALNGERYGLDIDHVVEIFTPETITPVPGAPAAIMGVTNLRGDIVTVIDLINALGLSRSKDQAGRQVILGMNGNVIGGFLVDRILGIWDVVTATIDPPLNTIEKIRAEHLTGEFKLADDLVGLLNAPNLLEVRDNA